MMRSKSLVSCTAIYYKIITIIPIPTPSITSIKNKMQSLFNFIFSEQAQNSEYPINTVVNVVDQF